MGESHDCPSASQVTLENMDEMDHYLTKTKHNKAQSISVFLGMHCYLWGNYDIHS